MVVPEGVGAEVSDCGAVVSYSRAGGLGRRIGVVCSCGGYAGGVAGLGMLGLTGKEGGKVSYSLWAKWKMSARRF